MQGRFKLILQGAQNNYFYKNRQQGYGIKGNPSKPDLFSDFQIKNDNFVLSYQKKEKETPKTAKERRDINLKQLKLLSLMGLAISTLAFTLLLYPSDKSIKKRLKDYPLALAVVSLFIFIIYLEDKHKEKTGRGARGIHTKSLF